MELLYIMENKPIIHLKQSKNKNHQENYKESLKSNHDIKVKLEFLMLDLPSIKAKQEKLMSEVSLIIKNSDHFIVNNNGDIIGFELIDYKNKLHNNLFEYYKSRTLDYNQISKHIHESNKTLEEAFNKDMLRTSYKNDLHNISRETESISNGKSILDYLFKELGDKINRIYTLNFKNKKSDHVINYHNKFYFSNYPNKVNEIDYKKEILPTQNKNTTPLSPTLYSNLDTNSLANNMNQNHASTTNYDISNKHYFPSSNKVVNITLTVSKNI